MKNNFVCICQHKRSGNHVLGLFYGPQLFWLHQWTFKNLFIPENKWFEYHAVWPRFCALLIHLPVGQFGSGLNTFDAWRRTVPLANQFWVTVTPLSQKWSGADVISLASDNSGGGSVFEDPCQKPLLTGVTGPLMFVIGGRTFLIHNHRYCHYLSDFIWVGRPPCPPTTIWKYSRESTNAIWLKSCLNPCHTQTAL